MLGGYVKVRTDFKRAGYTYVEDSRERAEEIVTPVAPDGPRQGLVPARRARMPLALFFSPLTGRGRWAWEEEAWSLYGHGKLEGRAPYTHTPPRGNQIRAGLQRLWYERYNTLRYDEGTL